MDNYTVYMHVSPSGKRYIGITCRKPEHRWANGKGYTGNDYFTKAINKYGWDSFEHIIVSKGLDEETAKWLEMELIKIWDSTNRSKGYNITFGGEGTTGWIPSEETRKKISKAQKGRKLSEEHKRKIGENSKSMWENEKYRNKMSEKKKGENNPNYGKHHSEETKKKISKSQKGKYIGKNHPMYGKNPRDYMSEDAKREHDRKLSGKNNYGAKAVICITTNKIFYTITEGAKYYGCQKTNIASCCKGKYKSAGKLSDGTKLVWRYIEIIEL